MVVLDTREYRMELCFLSLQLTACALSEGADTDSTSHLVFFLCKPDKYLPRRRSRRRRYLGIGSEDTRLFMRAGLVLGPVLVPCFPFAISFHHTVLMSLQPLIFWISLL
jgi:hypothetical protein